LKDDYSGTGSWWIRGGRLADIIFNLDKSVETGECENALFNKKRPLSVINNY